MLGAPVLITAPVGELISLPEAKGYLRVDGTDRDAEIALLAAAAVEDLQSQTGLRLLNQTVRVAADCFADLGHLHVGPVRQVVSITYRGPDGVEQLLATDQYELFGAPLEQGVRLAIGKSWPPYLARPQSIQVTFDVGYGASAANVPTPLRGAAYALMRGSFEGTDIDLEGTLTNYRIGL